MKKWLLLLIAIGCIVAGFAASVIIEDSVFWVSGSNTTVWFLSQTTVEEVAYDDLCINFTNLYLDVNISNQTTLLYEANNTYINISFCDGQVYYINTSYTAPVAPPVNISILDIYNWTDFCNYTFAENSSGAYLQEELCNGGKMFTGLGILIGINIGMFLLIFYLLNNMSVTIRENIKQTKTELFIKFMGVFLLLLLNLTVVGFSYYTAEQINNDLARLAFVYFLLNLIGFIYSIFWLGFKMFTFPFESVVDYLDKNNKYNIFAKKSKYPR